MSGPIIRKYGFPNFEKIFGERDLKHGAEPSPSKTDSSSAPTEAPKSEPGSVPTSTGEAASQKSTD